MTNGCVKGKVGERELANLLKDMGIEARRGQQYEGGSDSPDVVAGDCFSDIHIECKRKESGNIFEWLEQATEDAAPGKLPLVAHRKNGRPWVVIIDLKKFVQYIKES